MAKDSDNSAHQFADVSFFKTREKRINMDLTLRSIRLNEFEDIYDHIKQDFARGEYAPYQTLYQQLRDGVQTGLILIHEGREVAYSISTESEESGYVLISLLAVYKEYRGNGIGSFFLEKMREIYSDNKAIIVEVEKPELANTDKEKVIRERRIQFYENKGYYLVPDIDYSIWDVPMHLMALPLKASIMKINEEIEKGMYDIYLKLMGKPYIHKMEFKTVKSEKENT